MSGAPVVRWTSDLRGAVERVNRQVNTGIKPATDAETAGAEEFWTYPIRGRGDCEDIALEKRRRLVNEGLPRAALTLALAWHRQGLYSHAVLLLETHSGTFALDSMTDSIACWSAIPFNFEARERPDGRWVRYDQSAWSYDDVDGSERPPEPATSTECLRSPSRD